MGGLGSSRWQWHTKKTTVEECFRLSIYSLKSYLQPGISGTLYSRIGNRAIAGIGFHVLGKEKPRSIRFSHLAGMVSKLSEDTISLVNLTSTPLPWGGERYWFVCPTDGCQRRIAWLYLPPHEKNFGCRHCYDLSYQSQQENQWQRNFYKNLADGVFVNYPGITRKDIQALLQGNQTKHLRRLVIGEVLKELLEVDRFSGYLTAEDLCRQSGLSIENLKLLENARLLIPDTRDGRYRPRLAGWGKKLAFLLNEGWDLSEIKRWTHDRWSADNPKEWPPERDKWRTKSP